MIQPNPSQPHETHVPELDRLIDEMITSCCKALARSDGHTKLDRRIFRYRIAAQAAAVAVLSAVAENPDGSDVAHLPRLGIVRMRQLIRTIEAQ